MMKLCMTRFELDEDLQAIKAELPDESDDGLETDSDSSDNDMEFRYISDVEGDDPAEDTNDDSDGNQNQFRKSFPATQSTLKYSIVLKAN